eukprot:CFRG2550T1
MECVQIPIEQPTKETVENRTVTPTQEPARGRAYPVTPIAIARTQRNASEIVETPEVAHSKLAVAKPIHRTQ